MPQPPNIEKAQLCEIKWDDNQKPQMVGKRIDVQFNPQTLKVTYSNQISGGDKSGTSAKQFVGRGTTKLSFDLWFDVTVPATDASKNNVDDVRHLTKQIVDFITPYPKKENKDGQFIPPGVRFMWGSFLFDGIIDSINENLEFFSEDGKPLRASVSISMQSQEIQFKPPPDSGPVTTPGTQPMYQAKAGETLPNLAAQAGLAQDWKLIASANNIENPRRLVPGTLLNLNINISTK